jgi:hypothetical protein
LTFAVCGQDLLGNLHTVTREDERREPLSLRSTEKERENERFNNVVLAEWEEEEDDVSLGWFEGPCFNTPGFPLDIWRHFGAQYPSIDHGNAENHDKYFPCPFVPSVPLATDWKSRSLMSTRLK